MIKRAVLLASVAVALFSCGAYATPTFTLLPSDVSGFRGQTVGWGFSITNTSDTDWVVITGSNFCEVGGDPNFTDCTTNPFGPTLGTYTDYAGPDGIFLAPFEQGQDTFTSFPFSPGNPGDGVGQYAIFANAAFATDTGNIFLSYNLFLGDPRNGGTPDTANDPGNLEVSAAATLTVLPTPEPATLLTLGGALAALAGLKLRRRAR